MLGKRMYVQLNSRSLCCLFCIVLSLQDTVDPAQVNGHTQLACLAAARYQSPCVINSQDKPLLQGT